MQSLSYTRLVLIIPRIDRQSSRALSVATHLKLKNATRSNTGHTQHVFTATVLWICRERQHAGPDENTEGGSRQGHRRE